MPETPPAEPTEITAAAAPDETDVATDTETAGVTAEPVGVETPAEAQE
jgi:hypothetical protein